MDQSCYFILHLKILVNYILDAIHILL